MAVKALGAMEIAVEVLVINQTVEARTEVVIQTRVAGQVINQTAVAKVAVAMEIAVEDPAINLGTS